jgi:hypothetical protein
MTEATVTVPQGHNLLVTSLRNNTWVSIASSDRDLASNHTPVPNFSFPVAPGTYVVRTDGVIDSAGSEFLESVSRAIERFSAPEPARLRLTSDAPDQHIVDGIGEIPANGTSSCTITLEAVGTDDAPVIGQPQQAEIFLRTTGGALMDAAGENRIRSVTLRSGRAAFRLVSEASPKVITVSAFGQSPTLIRGEIQIEFV